MSDCEERWEDSWFAQQAKSAGAVADLLLDAFQVDAVRTPGVDMPRRGETR